MEIALIVTPVKPPAIAFDAVFIAESICLSSCANSKSIKGRIISAVVARKSFCSGAFTYSPTNFPSLPILSGIYFTFAAEENDNEIFSLHSEFLFASFELSAKSSFLTSLLLFRFFIIQFAQHLFVRILISL